jgi:mRNA interferase MazF
MFNRSSIPTVLVAALTTNLRYAQSPGNVLVRQGTGGLQYDSVVNVSQLVTIDIGDLDSKLGTLPAHLMDQVDAGLRLALDL